MKNKKGIELSVNFLVMFIIAIVVFGFGIYFISTLYGKVVDLNEQKQELFKNSIKNLKCGKSERICTTKDKKNGKPGDQVFFSVGVRNVLDTDKTFVYWVKNEKAFDKDNVDIILLLSNEYIYPEDGSVEKSEIGPLKKFEDGTGVIEIDVPETAAYGTYILDVEVQYEDSASTIPYGNLKLYLNVVP